MARCWSREETKRASLSTAEVYEPTSGTWSSTDSFVWARYGHTAVPLSDGQVLIAGGFHNVEQGPLATAELYNPVTQTWRAAGGLSTPRQSHTATLLPDGRVVIAGGWDGSSESFATVEVYDLATSKWSVTAPLHSARRYLVRRTAVTRIARPRFWEIASTVEGRRTERRGRMLQETQTTRLQNAGRELLGTMMVGAGTGHLTFARGPFQAQVPDWVPMDKDTVVLLSGVVEIGLGHQYAKRISAFGLDTDTKRFVRLFFQPVLMGWDLRSTGAWKALRQQA